MAVWLADWCVQQMSKVTRWLRRAWRATEESAVGFYGCTCGEWISARDAPCDFALVAALHSRRFTRRKSMDSHQFASYVASLSGDDARPFSWAAEQVALLLAAYSAGANELDSNGCLPLHLAALGV